MAAAGLELTSGSGDWLSCDVCHCRSGDCFHNWDVECLWDIDCWYDDVEELWKPGDRCGSLFAAVESSLIVSGKFKLVIGGLERLQMLG